VVLYSKTTELPKGIVIETDRGIVQLADSDDAESISFRSHSYPQVEEILRRNGKTPYPPNVNVFQRQLEDFAGACLAGRRPMIDGDQGLMSLRLHEELYARRKSLRTDWYSDLSANGAS
jgi:predicted dehydrogenase